jgi:stearoyl-CoA desaturase (delta-9 desaturase)
MQFIMAWTAVSSAQKGVIWWAANHRHHHLHSDHEEDIHSPALQGFWHSHVGWLLSKENADTQTDLVKDLMKYPEIRWLDRHHIFPVVVTALMCLAIGGLSGLVVGFFISTVLTWHATFTINSLSHVFGKQRYQTGDDSKNNFFLALLTLGEGWHNNHHHYQSSTNQGFFWWEIDITYYVLVLMSKVGLVWDLRRPPKHVIEGKSNPRKSSLLKQAQQTSTISMVGDTIQGMGTKR